MIIQTIPQKSAAILDHGLISLDGYTHFQEHEVNLINSLGVPY